MVVVVVVVVTAHTVVAMWFMVVTGVVEPPVMSPVNDITVRIPVMLTCFFPIRLRETHRCVAVLSPWPYL